MVQIAACVKDTLLLEPQSGNYRVCGSLDMDGLDMPLSQVIARRLGGGLFLVDWDRTGWNVDRL